MNDKVTPWIDWSWPGWWCFVLPIAGAFLWHNGAHEIVVFAAMVGAAVLVLWVQRLVERIERLERKTGHLFLPPRGQRAEFLEWVEPKQEKRSGEDGLT